jgi:hypothetical protein
VAAARSDAGLVARQLAAHFPECSIAKGINALADQWLAEESTEEVTVDFGLAAEFMLPLAKPSKFDPMIGLIAAMSGLQTGEMALYQIIFSPTEDDWAGEAARAVHWPNGKPRAELDERIARALSEKFSQPLFGVSIRLAAQAATIDRACEILRESAPMLRHFAVPGLQRFAPLVEADSTGQLLHEEVLRRCSRRSGMLLNMGELACLVRFPTSAVRSDKLLRRPETNTRLAPKPDDRSSDAIVLGMNDHDGDSREVLLSTAHRLQHVHCIGASGTGKSTLLLSMMLQDLVGGRGFALLDPHGDLADAVLARIPTHRMDDVVVFDPSDEEFVIPFNVLSAHSDYEKALLASDLVGVFRRLSSSWGDRMGIIFQNLVLAFLEHPQGGTLADMRRFLVDPVWRGEFLAKLDDPDIAFYWEQTFPRLDGPKSIGPILTRLESLLTPKIIRYMVSQRENRIDFSDIMDRRKILLVRLPQGQIGAENSFMLGSLIMVKLQQMAMSRARLSAPERTPFFCYVDECQHFVTPSMAAILSGARKYGLGLILAHQDLHQLSQSGDVAAAVMTNASTRIVFRVSDADGRALKGDFAHFDSKDFSTLARGQAICRLGRADQDFNLRVLLPPEPSAAEFDRNRRQAIEASRTLYSISRRKIEAAIKQGMPVARTSNPAEPPTQLTNSGEEDSLKEKLRTPVVPTVPPEAPAIENPLPEPRPGLPGKGGPRHLALQNQIKQIAEAKGFRAIIEFPVGSTGESIDVLLARDGRRIACEISVTTSPEDELRNARKCLRQEFYATFIIAEDPVSTVRLQSALAAGLNPDGMSKTRVFTPDQFSTQLDDLLQNFPTDGEKRIGGFKIKRTYAALSPAERAAKLDAFFDLLAAEMKLPPEPQQ